MDSEAHAALLAGPHHLAAHFDKRWNNRRHTRLIGKAVREAIETKGSRTAVITPPQVGKSSLCSVWAPFWALMHDPSKKLVTASYGQHLANRNGRYVRNLVRDFGPTFGRTLASDAKSVAEWYTPEGGGFKSASVGSGLTGFTADMLILDDLIKNRIEAESPVVRDALWEWLSSSALTRLSPGAPVFMIGTLWTERDPILRLIEQEGRAEDGGRWKVIHLPAIADTSLTGVRDPLGRQNEDPLTHPLIADDDPETLLKHWRDKKASVLPRDWQALYQGDPHPREGALVSWDIMEAATVPLSAVPDPLRVVVSVDPSGGGVDEVGIVCAVLGTDEVCYVIADVSATMPVTAWPEVVCDLAEQHEADRIILEANFGGRLVETPIRAAWTSKQRSTIMPAISRVRAMRGKVLRAEPIAQQMAMGRFKVVSGLDRLMKQWTSFQAGATDSPGALDASVYAAVSLLRVPMAGLMSEDASDSPATVTTPTRRTRGMVPGTSRPRNPSVAPVGGRRRPGH